MPEKKKQHYVPKLYLKFFSNFNNRTHIGLFNLRTNLYIKSASIDGQNQEDYFYGKESDIEDAFGDLETRTCNIIREIILTYNLPPKDSDDYCLLLEYVMYQQKRTKLSALKNENLQNQLTQMILKDRFVPTNEIAEIKIEYEYPGLAGLEIVPDLISAVSDLKCKLLINKTKESFITSDHPVIKWNQFLNQRKYPEPRTGLAMKGLKLLFPISPNIILAYYDSEIYSLGNEDIVVEIFNPKDVWILNFIQSISCNEVVFFNQEIDESYAKRLLTERKYLNTRIIARIQDYCNANNCTINLNDIQFDNLILDQIESLSFIRENAQVNTIDLSKPSDYIRPSSQIDTEDSKLTEAIFIEAMKDRFK